MTQAYLPLVDFHRTVVLECRATLSRRPSIVHGKIWGSCTFLPLRGVIAHGPIVFTVDTGVS